MERLPHAVLDRQPRVAKGRKVAAIVQEYMSLEGASVLDVGTGGGFLAEYFEQFVGDTGRVVGVDRICQLPDDSSIEFHQVDDVRLPFEDETFDLVISNHVIEHVGENGDQLSHLRELRRVVIDGGLIYVAAPNRWTPFEPHFRLPFLSWMPKGLSSFFVRLFNRGEEYDCELLTRPQFFDLADQADLATRDVTARALQIYARNEMTGPMGNLVAAFPGWLAALVAGLWFIPSLVFLCSRPRREESGTPGRQSKTTVPS